MNITNKDIQFLKIRDVKSPTRNDGDAGIDFFIPNASLSFIAELKNKNSARSSANFETTTNGILMKPGTDILIPSGILSKFPKNMALTAAEKSGVATKQMLLTGAKVIDSSYQGEIHIHLINVSNTTQFILFGQKIVQFIPRLIVDGAITETDNIKENISSEEFYDGVVTNRGAGGFGSTGVI